MSNEKAYQKPLVTVRTREGIAELQGNQWVFYKTNGKGRRYRAEIPERLRKQLRDVEAIQKTD